MKLSDIYDFRTGIVRGKIKDIPNYIYVADVEPVRLNIAELISIQVSVYNNEDCHIFTNIRDCEKFILKQKEKLSK